MGKNLSLLSKLWASLFVCGAFFYFIATSKTITPDQAQAIIYIGLFLALVYSPIDVSFWLEKFVKMFQRVGNEEND